MAHYSDVAHKSYCGLNVLPCGDMGAHTCTAAPSPSFMEITAAAGFDKCASVTPHCRLGSKSCWLLWEWSLEHRRRVAWQVGLGVSPPEIPASWGEECGQTTHLCFLDSTILSYSEISRQYLWFTQFLTICYQGRTPWTISPMRTDTMPVFVQMLYPDLWPDMDNLLKILTE